MRKEGKGTDAKRLRHQVVGVKAVAEHGLQTVLQRLRKLAGLREAAAQPDGELLGRYVADGDETAFTALVERHGPLVLGVCLRVLRHRQDAEDACQAAFLLLARRAASVRKRESVASWLHGVAYHLATNLRRGRARREGRRPPARDVPPADALAELSWREVRIALDEEIARLPERYRAGLVLCYLDGRTREEAARLLGWSDGTLRGRLERGRELLRTRLAGRGFAPAALLAAGTATDAAPLPPLLVCSTVNGAAAVAAGRRLAGVVAPQVVSLVDGGLKAMLFTKLKAASALALTVALAGVGTWRGTAWATAQPEGPTPPGVTADQPPPGGAAKPAGGKDMGKKADRQPDVIFPERLRFERGVAERVVTVSFTVAKAEYVGERQFQDPIVGKDERLLRLWAGETFYAYLTGKAEAQVRRLGLDPEAYFRGRQMRVTGRVECVTESGKEKVIAGGTYDRYRLVVSDLEGLEVVKE